jgi:ABC-type branched-subunit amino acid transport system substrate-binding protein
MKRLSLLALFLSGCLAPTVIPSTDEGVPIGVLLPYTGELATVGQNLERAVILANEQLAQAEPNPALPPFRLIFRDTHSDDVEGLKAADDLIDRQRAAFILGPEEPLLAESMAPSLRDKTVAISGGAVSLESSTGINDWFRIVPTAKQLSAALADQMLSDTVSKLAIIYVPDAYGMAFSRLAAEEFVKRQGTVVMMAALGDDVSPGQVVRDVVAAGPEAILLVTYPTAGAAVVQEWALIGKTERWYFAPSLRSEIFAASVPPGLFDRAGVSDGMIGISAGLAADARNFARVFQARWSGELPTPNAHYYFDAMLLAGMAYRSAAALIDNARRPTSRELASALIATSGPGGTIRTWQEVRPALEALEKKIDIDYRGITGPVNFSPDGSVPQGFVQKWTIKDGAIVAL